MFNFYVCGLAARFIALMRRKLHTLRDLRTGTHSYFNYHTGQFEWYEDQEDFGPRDSMFRMALDSLGRELDGDSDY